MVQGTSFCLTCRKTSENFSKLHSAVIHSSKHKYKYKRTRHYSNAGTQVSSLLGCDITLGGKHLPVLKRSVLPSSSGSRSLRTDVYDTVETRQ
jgi:hypothetical protein